MQIKCNYCGSMIEENLESCPHCGAPLSGVNRTAAGQPNTIEELKAWYTSHHLPPENITRFFIGKDIKEPKAFGIYKTETGDFVVYKNKANGERAIRYQGSDEKYAVNELYQRLRAEIVDQKARNNTRKDSGNNSSNYNYTTDNKKKNKTLGCIGIIASIITFLGLGWLTMYLDKDPSNGAYKYQGKEYYYQNSKWYEYDNETDTWGLAAESEALSKAINKDNADEYRYYDHEGTSFEETPWYDNGYHSNEGSSYSSYDDDDDGWDNDSSWDDDDDWDSGSSDWDSDW